MARGINRVILIGNLGADPEVRYSPSGAAVTNIRIATSERWKDKQTGEMQERTEWHRVVFFGRLAEIAGEYLRRGGRVYVEGRLQTRKWQGQDGQDRFTTEVVGNEMQMLDAREETGGEQRGAPRGSNAQARSGAGARAAQGQQGGPGGGGGPAAGPPASDPPSAPAPAPADAGMPPAADWDDDIPF